MVFFNLVKAADYSQSSKAINAFKATCKDLSLIEKPLDLLQKTFSSNIRLTHTREIYPFYEALTIVSAEVAKRNMLQMSTEWKNVLSTLNNRKITLIGQGITKFDTSFASKVATRSLTKLQQTLRIGPIDLRYSTNRREVVDYIYRSGSEIHNFCYSQGFIEDIIGSKNVRCIVARDESQNIVGILWGFLDSHETTPLFHFWELSRVPKMAHMGIAKRMIESAKKQQALYPHIQFATLNVDSENHRAKNIYDNEKFAPLDSKEKQALKIFMSQNLKKNNGAGLNATTKQVVTKFVMATIPIYKLLYFELIRRCRLLFRALWYR
jgi:ribosomal protein S18 acetylase RimI-like enzyme